MAYVCRNGESCKFLAEGRCRFRHIVVEKNEEIIRASPFYTEDDVVEKKQIPVVRPPYSRYTPKKEEEKMIGGFPVSMIKGMARDTMNDQKYHEFVRACDGGAQEHVLVAMLYVADKHSKW